MSRLNIVKFVSVCFLSCGIIMFILFVTMGQSNRAKNGFNRRLPTTKLIVDKEVPLAGEDFYIAGHTSSSIYFGNIKKPFYLFVSDSNLQNIQSLQLQFPLNLRYSWQSARMCVDSPYIYMSDGITPKFFTGNLASLKMDTFMSRSSYFTAAANISPGSFAVRAVNTLTNENMLLKVQSDSPYVTKRTDVLKKQVDGVFCTDGELKYDRASNILVYMYYYRNQFLLLDTNLHVLKKIKTIDTTNIAKIDIANTSEHGDFILSSPPSFVNAGTCIYKDKVFVRSALLADNEGHSIIDKNNTVDVYSAVNGDYLQSFYIPKQHEESVRDMFIFRDKLLALYAHSFVVYHLSKDLLLQ